MLRAALYVAVNSKIDDGLWCENYKPKVGIIVTSRSIDGKRYTWDVFKKWQTDRVEACRWSWDPDRRWHVGNATVVRDIEHAEGLLTDWGRRYVTRITMFQNEDYESNNATVYSVGHAGCSEGRRVAAATIVQAAYRGTLGRRRAEHERFKPGGPGFEAAKRRFEDAAESM